MTRTLVIPDGQVRHGVNLDHWADIGELINEVQPENIVNLGDFADHEAISSYHTARSAEGKRLAKDNDAVKYAYELHTVRWASRAYSPRKVYVEGNHCHRFAKFIAENPVLDGSLVNPITTTFGADGWEVVPFLGVRVINGVKYSHFFPRSADGCIKQTKNGAGSARLQAMREMQSCTAGHLQGFSYYEHGLGTRIVQSMIVGACYTHAEGYLSAQGNRHFRGVIMKTHNRDGSYDFERLSLSALRRRYR